MIKVKIAASLDVRYDYGFIVTSLISVNVKTLGYGVGLRNYQSGFKRGL